MKTEKSELFAGLDWPKRSARSPMLPATSKELFSVLEARKKSFWWKPGRYDIEIQLSSPQKFKLSSPGFHFHLTANDVDLLKKNLVSLDTELKNIVSSNLPDFQARPLNWNWANVDVLRVTNA